MPFNFTRINSVKKAAEIRKYTEPVPAIDLASVQEAEDFWAMEVQPYALQMKNHYPAVPILVARGFHEALDGAVEITNVVGRSTPVNLFYVREINGQDTEFSVAKLLLSWQHDKPGCLAQLMPQ